MMAGSKTSKENVTFSVVYLFCIAGNSSILVYRNNPFVCLWTGTNCFFNNLNETG